MSAPPSTSRRTARLAGNEGDNKAGRSAAPKQTQPPPQSTADESEDEEDYSEDYCAYCGAEGILAICDVPQCGKVYHAECLGYNPSGLREFFCPRHRCALCNRPDVEIDSAGGIELVKCKSCPTSYCPHHRPEESEFKKAMAVSSVDPLSDTAVMGLFVPHPDLVATDQGAQANKAVVEEVAGTADVDDSMSRPSKRARVQFALESGLDSAAAVDSTATNGGGTSASVVEEKGAAASAGIAGKNAAPDGLPRKSAEEDSDQDTVPDSAAQSPEQEGEGRAPRDSTAGSKAGSGAQGGKKAGAQAGKPPLAPAARRPGTRLASAAQASAASGDGISTTEAAPVTAAGSGQGSGHSGLVSGTSTPGDQSDADSTGPRRSKRKRLSEGQLEKAVAGMPRVEADTTTATAAAGPEGATTEQEDAAPDTERIGPAPTAVSRLSVSIAPLDSPSSAMEGGVSLSGGGGPSSVRAAGTPSEGTAGRAGVKAGAAGASIAGGVLSVATPMSGSNLALAAAKVGKRAADPILAEKLREKAGVSTGKQSTCIACGVPSVRLAFSRALEAAWVDAVIRLLAKREGKEEPGISILVVQDAGLIGMGVDMASLQSSDKGPNVLIQALLAPVTDPDVVPLYESAGHGRAALSSGADATRPVSIQGSPTSKKDALLQAVGCAEPSAVAAVLCTPHEYACVPAKPACYGDILARIRTGAYTKLADVVSDVKYVTRVIGVISGALPPEILSMRGDEPLPSHLQRVQAATAGGPLKAGGGPPGSDAGQAAATAMPTPSWAVDANTGEVNDEALRGGYVAPGDLQLPTVEIMSEANTSTASAQTLGVPVKTMGPQAFASDQERLTAAVNSGVADNPRMLFYQASLTVAEVFIRRFTKDRKQGKMLRDLEQRLSSESTGQPPLPEALKVLPSLPESVMSSFYSASSGSGTSSTSTSAQPVPVTTWLPALLEHLGLTDEEALARLFAARLSCSRPELSWTHRAYQFQRASLSTWLAALQAQVPAGGSRRPIDAAKKSLTDEKNRRKSIIQAPGTDKIRYGTNFEDMLDSIAEADTTASSVRGGMDGLASPSLMDVDLSSAAARSLSLALKLQKNMQSVAHTQTAPLRSATGGNVEPHSVLLLPVPTQEKDETMAGTEDADAHVPVGVAYDQAIAEYTATDIIRVVKREHKRKQEQDGGGQGAAAGKGNGTQGPVISDAELQRCESAVVWAREEYLRVTNLPETAAGGPLSARSPTASGEKPGLHRSKGSFFGVGGLSGAAEGRSGGGTAPRDVVPFEQPSWQPAFGTSGSNSASHIPGLSQSAIADALAKLTQLIPGAHESASTHAPGPVVVIGGPSSSSSFPVVGSTGSGQAGESSARLTQAEQAIQALAQASQREMSSLRAQMGDMASAMGVLLAGTAQAQASLHATVSGLSTAILDLKTLVEEQGARSATGRRITPTMAVPAAPGMEHVRTALGMLRAEERSAGVLLTEMAAMDLDLEAGQGGTPGLMDLLPPSPEEVAGIFDTLSSSLRAGLVATGELRTAWAASRRALLSIPARVDVERRLVVRAGLDSDALAMQWNMGAGAETRLRRPPVLSAEALASAASGGASRNSAEGGEEDMSEQQDAGAGVGEWVGDEDFSEGIITLGEGRVAAEYAVANAALRHHVNKLRMQLAAHAASTSLQESSSKLPSSAGKG